MRVVTTVKHWRQWFNSTRPRIFVWYFLLTAFSSVTSILVTHHILYERIRDQSREYVSRQIREFQQIARQQRIDTTVAPEQQATIVLDAFLAQYEPVDADDYAIALLNGQVYRYSNQVPAKLLVEEADLLQEWGQLTTPNHDIVNTAAGELFYFAEPVVVNGQTQGVLVIVHCADSEYQVVNGAVLLIIPATLGVMAVAAAIAWATAGRVLAPLRVLTQTAQSITESDMTQRIAVEGTDEIAHLTTTFNEMLDRLQIAFESQQEFLKDAGHELRTPITVIRGYLETLKYRPERQAETIALAIDELDRMNRLVNDLLLLAKAERPDFLALRLEELDWLTEELYLKVRSMADRQWKLESKGLSPIRVDRQRITQAVMNLVQNAIRHTQEGDAIALGSSVRDDHAYIWVRDTGEGIALEDQARIFERFARATTRQIQGDVDEALGENHGLGLAIVEAIAQAHGGWVELLSRPGQGSTFTIVIPLEASTDRATHESDSDHRRQSPHHRLFGVRSTGARLHDHRR
ncbi:HAMP domain-containing histidine kinase [Oscillatoria sp. FACHB-1407]|uniref:sensor histidine kinase n=1 Tax=Oscillatoria sp. FACHB-1407 TaxID=2692847 RepID=UPI0016849FEC|nr:HAMP domain-containing sensor histidine kinase [Oscillatoria sp. FACHB-1407]MBD2462515.1 HAMP domain-containing histidine kinase [Oscillatoria sp. FACHB-1407]